MNDRFNWTLHVTFYRQLITAMHTSKWLVIWLILRFVKEVVFGELTKSEYERQGLFLRTERGNQKINFREEFKRTNNRNRRNEENTIKDTSYRKGCILAN